jgi:PKD repeat protein
LYVYPAGTYTITLTASNSAGISSIVSSNLITVLTALQAWQIQYFSSTNNPAANPAADPDGDGCNNLCEFLAGMDPTNSASSFRITSIVTQGTDVRVTWATAGGRTNVLQATDGSYSNSFFDVSPFIIVPGSGTTATNYPDVGGATNLPGRYYRILLVP